MRGKPVSTKEKQKMISLREHGCSLPEIRRIMQRGNATVYKYIKNTEILPEYKDILRKKQGGSINRSQKQWEYARHEAKKIIASIDKKMLILIGCALYWGEGTKKELNLINSDPDLIKIFLSSLYALGVSKNDVRITLRTYEDVNIRQAKKFWSRTLNIPSRQILNINILKGK